MALPDPGSPSPGEIGGIFAGIVALLATIGAGLKWLLGWKERREATFHAKLLAWEQKLTEREALLDAEQAGHFARLERRIEKLERENTNYRRSHDELRRIDPANPVAAAVEAALRSVFPIDPATPADMMQTLGKID